MTTYRREIATEMGIVESKATANAASNAWSGKLYSKKITLSDSVVKVEASAKLLHDVVFHNIDAADGAYIGIYHATVGTMRNTAFALEFGESIGFQKVDLNTVALVSHTNGDTPVIEIIGVEE